MIFRSLCLVVILSCSIAANMTGQSVTPLVRGMRRSLATDRSKPSDKKYKKGIVYHQNFAMICKVLLTREAKDEQITQKAYASVIFDFCDHARNPGAQCIKRTSFSDLPSILQMTFTSVSGDCFSKAYKEKRECSIQMETKFTVAVGDVGDLCDRTYVSMIEAGMLVDPTSTPSTATAVTRAPSLMPAFTPTQAPMAMSPTTSQVRVDVASRVPTMNPTLDTSPSLRPHPSVRTTESIATDAAEETGVSLGPNDNDVSSARNIGLAAAALTALVLAKIALMAIYVKLRRQHKEMRNEAMDPYLQEHSALGSEHSFALSFDIDDHGQTKKLLKPCEQITILDSLDPAKSQKRSFPSKLASDNSNHDERALCLASSILDGRFIPYSEEATVIGDLSQFNDDIQMYPASSILSGTKSDPIPIATETSDREAMLISRRQWKNFQNGSDDDEEWIGQPNREPGSRNRRRRRGKSDSSNTCSSSISAASINSSVISIDEEIRRRFEEFDESVTSGIEMLRSDLADDDADYVSSIASVDDSISSRLTL